MSNGPLWNEYLADDLGLDLSLENNYSLVVVSKHITVARRTTPAILDIDLRTLITVKGKGS